MTIALSFAFITLSPDIDSGAKGLLSSFTGNDVTETVNHRHLLNSTGVKLPTGDDVRIVGLEKEKSEYPPNLLNKQQRQDGGIVLYAIGVLYTFVALAIVCDEFFVPALEALVETYDIEEDVAGATFMAAGGSAPELFTSLIGVFIAKSNVGFGTIIGSAVFNVLFVIGMCAFFSSVLLELTWWPLARDCSFYTLDLVIVFIFFRTGKEISFYDLDGVFIEKKQVGMIEWWEAFLMLCLYGAYVIFMKYNQAAEVRVKALVTSKVQPAADGAPPAAAKPEVEIDAEMVARISAIKEHVPAYKVRSTLHVNALQLMLREIDEKDPLKLENRSSDNRPSQVSIIQDGESKEEGKEPEKKEEEAEEEEDGIDLSWPDNFLGQVNYVLTAPIVYSLVATLPNCKKEESKKYFWVTFFGSILWIGFFSYWMVWWSTEVGKVIGIPDEVMGLTFLAAGTSVPDLMSSVIVARQGLGDMAVSSSIGSNIFDITFGLPLPWLIWSLAHNGKAYEVDSESLAFSLVLLIIMLVAVVITIAMSNWKMTKGLGAAMFALYGVFLMLSLLKTYNKLGALNDF